MRWGYGWLYHLRGELARSEAAYLRGLESARNPQHPDELAACDMLWFLGFLYATAGRAGAAPAEALHNAQIALRTATATRLAALLTNWPAAAGPPPDLSDLFPTPNDQFPFADPAYWAPFLLLGRA